MLTKYPREIVQTVVRKSATTLANINIGLYIYLYKFICSTYRYIIYVYIYIIIFILLSNSLDGLVAEAWILYFRSLFDVY